MTLHMVAFLPPKSTRVLAGIEFRQCKLDQATRKGADLAETHGVQGMARGDGREIVWAIPRNPTKSAKCWICWTHDSRDWYAATVEGPQFLKAMRAVLNEVVR